MKKPAPASRRMPRKSPKAKARPTIRDVAREARVSVSTVSHVLSGKRPISSPVQKRVQGVVARLGYRANANAVRLSNRRTLQLGLLMREITSSITGALLEHMEEAARQAGYKVLLAICRDDAALAHAYLGEFASGMVDGVLNLVPGLGAEEAVRACPAVPVLTYLRPHPDSPALYDKRGGAEAMMRHLYALGHRRIAFLCEPDLAPELPADPREEGVRAFLASVGLRAEPALFRSVGPLRHEGIFTALDSVRRAGATAVFAASDSIAAVALRWAHERGLAVPKDFSIGGFDDAPIAAVLVPPLCTVRMPVREVAHGTIQALVDRVEGRRPAPQAVLPMELVVRGSTAGPSP